MATDSRQIVNHPNTSAVFYLLHDDMSINLFLLVIKVEAKLLIVKTIKTIFCPSALRSGCFQANRERQEAMIDGAVGVTQRWFLYLFTYIVLFLYNNPG